MNFINQRQDDKTHITLLRAANVYHRRAATLETLRWVVALAAGLAALAAALFPAAEIYSVVGSLLVAIVVEGLTQVGLRHFNLQSAILQEQFDLSLFGIDWQQGHPPIALATVGSLSATYRGSDARLRNWYTDVRGIPEPTAQALCQRQNLLWDSQLRNDWAWRLMSFVAGYYALGYLVALIFSWTVADLTLWWIGPSLPLAIPALVNIRMQRSLVKARRDGLTEMQTALDKFGGDSAHDRELLDQCRSTQQVIFATRARSPRVPSWFYRRRKSLYEIGFSLESEAFRSQWGTGDS